MKEIAKKMALITKEIQQPNKTGAHPSIRDHRYSTKDDVFMVVREVMSAHGMAILPSSEVMETTADGTTRVRLTIVIMDGDSGEMLTSTWDGEWKTSKLGAFGAVGASTQALRAWAANTFLLLDGDYHDEYTGTAKKEVTTVHSAPPEDALKAIETRVRRLKFSEEQLDQYLDFIAEKEGADVITDVPEGRLLYWHNRMEGNDDRAMTDGINKLIQGVSA